MSSYQSHSTANRNTVVGELFYRSSLDLSSYGPYMALREAKRQIGFKQQAAYQELEDFLNSVYSLDIDRDRYAYAEEFQASVADFIKGEISKMELDHTNFVKSGIAEHDVYIVYNTIAKRCQSIESMIKQLSDSKIREYFRDDGIKRTRQSILNVIEQAKQVASSEENILKHFFIKEGRVKKEDRALIKELDKIYAVTKTLNTNFEKIYGDSFEMGLASLAYHLNVAKDKSIQECFKMMKNRNNKKLRAQWIQGNQQAYRGQVQSDLFTFSVNGKKVTTEPSITKSTNWTKIQNFTTFDQKQGKVDVIFTLPALTSGLEIPETFRISAKSWSALTGHDFGTTSLRNAMLRTINLDKTLEYGLVVGYYDSRGKMFSWIWAHQLAKVCAILDILMGYSQQATEKSGAHYADTIVIEDKSNHSHPIKVISIYNLLHNIEEQIDKIDKLRVNGYDDRQVAQALAFNKATLSKQHARGYLTHLLAKMHEIKLTVSMNNIKPFID